MSHSERRPNEERNATSLRDIKNMSDIDFYNSAHKDNGYGIFFTDPATGEELPTDRLPDFLAQEEGLRNGYEFLNKFNKQFKLEIFFAAHKPNAPESLVELQTRVEASDIVLLEGVSWTDSVRKMLNDLSFSRPDLDENTIRDFTLYINERGEQELGDTYAIEKLNIINRSKKHISFFDVKRPDSSKPNDDKFGIRKQLCGAELLRQGIRASQITGAANPTEEKVIRNMAVDTHIVCNEALREWYMTANTGSEIGELCHNNPDLLEKFKTGKLKVLIVVGSSHGDLVRKFETAGVDVRLSTPPNTTEHGPADGQVPKWLAQGFIDKTELRRLCEESL